MPWRLLRMIRHAFASYPGPFVDPSRTWITYIHYSGGRGISNQAEKAFNVMVKTVPKVAIVPDVPIVSTPAISRAETARKLDEQGLMRRVEFMFER